MQQQVFFTCKAFEPNYYVIIFLCNADYFWCVLSVLRWCLAFRVASKLFSKRYCFSDFFFFLFYTWMIRFFGKFSLNVFDRSYKSVLKLRRVRTTAFDYLIFTRFTYTCSDYRIRVLVRFCLAKIWARGSQSDCACFFFKSPEKTYGQVTYECVPRHKGSVSNTDSCFTCFTSPTV